MFDEGFDIAARQLADYLVLFARDPSLRNLGQDA